MYKVDNMTLSRDLRITISGLAKNSEEKCDLEIMTKEKKLDFHHTLALGLRKRFTLVNHLLTQLSDIDPVLICNEKSALCTTLNFFQHPAMMQEKERKKIQPVQRNLWEMKEL